MNGKMSINRTVYQLTIKSTSNHLSPIEPVVENQFIKSIDDDLMLCYSFMICRSW